MCYAIPGKIIEINDNIITVDYFGEKKKARNEFYELSSGDYIYAQGGFVIQKIPEDEALDILKGWEELFFKLQEIDLRLTEKSKNIYQTANKVRQRYHGNSCCVHGIIEFSNYCRNDCLYCGLRQGNDRLTRYRMSVDEIVDAAEHAVKDLKFKALVLQSGEDESYDEEKLAGVIRRIMKDAAALLVLSIGERDVELYARLYSEGARGVLLRFETSDNLLYEKYRPGHKLEDRLKLIERLKSIGYLVFTGFLIGLPGQTEKDTSRDIEMLGSLSPDMLSFGPFIPHPDTPLKKSPTVSADFILKTMAEVRIKYPESKILVTTALETLDKKDGLKAGLLSGANSVMVNATPSKYRRLYEIYPDRAGVAEPASERIATVLELLRSIGRAPTDLGL